MAERRTEEERLQFHRQQYRQIFSRLTENERYEACLKVIRNIFEATLTYYFINRGKTDYTRTRSVLKHEIPYYERWHRAVFRDTQYIRDAYQEARRRQEEIRENSELNLDRFHLRQRTEANQENNARNLEQNRIAREIFGNEGSTQNTQENRETPPAANEMQVEAVSPIPNEEDENIFIERCLRHRKFVTFCLNSRRDIIRRFNLSL